MSNPIENSWSPRGWLIRSRPVARAIIATLIVTLGPRAWAVPPQTDDTAGPKAVAGPATGAAVEKSALEERLRRLEALGASVSEQNRRLTEQNRQLDEQNQKINRQLQEVNLRYDELERRLDRATPAISPATALPALANPAAAGPPPRAPDPLPRRNPSQDPGRDGSRFLIGGYDEKKSQFILAQPKDPESTPFALNFDLITELRYTGFSRSARTWTNSAGAVLPVNNASAFAVNRNWFQFTGYALDPRLQFMAILFNSSTTNSTIFLGWIDYRISKAFTLSGGYYKVPGSREWYDSFRYTLGADRTMATTFFRPNMSPGVWASGEPAENLHYVAMVANSFNGLNIVNNRIGSSTAFGGTLWWEPQGTFGPGPSDVEWHERPTSRIGTSLTVSREQLASAAEVQNNPENTLFRLSDGTPLASTGALGPGVQVNTTSVQLWSIDAAIKYRGLGLSGEYYFRWLDDFRHTGGPLSIHSLFDSGAYAQASYFFIPERLEGYARSSFVTGRFGSGDEWSGGLNWYVLGTRNWRVTFDATRINHSPADNALTGYRAGESGTLFQLQTLIDF